MRFERIALTAYGMFTQKILDFSDPSKTIHVIHGPNEAGKSTLKNAIAELLFGFHTQTAYGFKHPYPAMELGATLVNREGLRLAIVRKKRQRGNDLFGSDNEQLSNAALIPFIGGLTKEIYENQFCLSREGMIDGSKEIAAGKGDVGESLYSAALGNARLHEIIVRLEKQRNDLFLPTGRTKTLNAAIFEYEAQRTAVRAAITRPDEWLRLTQQQDKLRNEIGDFTRRIGDLSALRTSLTSMNACYPNYDRLRMSRAALLEASNEPRMSPEEVSNTIVLLTDLEALEREIFSINSRVARIVKDIGPDSASPLIEQRAVIDALKGGVESYRKGLDDLRRLDLRGYARTAAEDARRHVDLVWPSIKLEEARMRIVTPDLRARGNELAIEVVRLTDRCATAAATDRGIVDEVTEIDGELSALGAARDVDALRAAVAAASAEPKLDAQVGVAELTYAQASAGAGSALASLGLFSGSLSELVSSAIPLLATVDRHAQAQDALRARESRNAERVVEMRVQHADACEQLDAMAREREIRTLTELTTARADRDGYFDALTARWREGVAIDEIDKAADVYRPAVESADRLADTLRAEADRVARASSLAAHRDAALEELNRLSEEASAISSDCDRARVDWEAEWNPVLVSPLSPAEMRSWMTTVSEVRRFATDVDNAQSERDDRLKTRAELRAKLVESLAALGCADPGGVKIEPVLGLARHELTAADELEGTRKRLQLDRERKQRALEKHRQDTSKATTSLETVSSEFGMLLERMWLPANFPAGALADTLSAIASFHELDKVARGNERRADGIERDNAKFAGEAVAFVTRYAVDLKELALATPDVVAEKLHERLIAAQTEHDQRVIHEKQLETEKVTLAEAAQRHDFLADNLATVLERQGIGREVLPTRLERSRILNNHAQVVAAETAHIETGTGKTIAVCDVEYGDRDRTKIATDLAIASGDIDNLTGERATLEPDLWELNAKIRDMDGSRAAADAQARLAELGAKVDHGARRWIEISIALHVLNEQIREFTELNQGVLITRASFYLNMLTGEAYEKLRAVDNGERKVLEAVRRDGQGVEIDGLSEGTRDQLFLALRLAALENYLQTAEPQPLILDDTFIAFDDARTLKAFQALCDIAGQTQVLYFTHHTACVEAARKGIFPELLAVHELTDPVGTADELALAPA